MSKPPAFGESAKGHRGRLRSTYSLPVHLEGKPIPFPMKPRTFFLPTLLGSICLSGLHGETAEPVRTAPTTTEATIPEPTAEKAPTTTPVEKPDFEIESTQIKLVEVVESPPMTGLPPVEGTMKLTVHTVADPGLPDTAPPTVDANPPSAEADSTATVEDAAEAHLVSISATVYDRSRTFLVCHPMGGGEPVSVWSNIDFNHFGGVGAFEAKGADGQARSYHLMMGIGNEDSAQLAEDPNAPQIPTLPDGTPAFRIVTENPTPEAVKLVEDLHALYRAEGARMAADVAARERQNEERKAYLLAHPPKPKDVTVHFWKRETTPETQTPEGTQP